MQKIFRAGARNPLLLCTFILGLMTALVYVPYQFSSQAGGKQVKKGLAQRTESHEEGLENYDIRADKSAFEKLAGFRQAQGKGADLVADVRSDFVSGEELLRTKVPTLTVEYNSDIRTPEVIAPDVTQGRAFLTERSSEKRSEILRDFVKENNSLVGVSDNQADSLKVTADYTNPDGNLSFAQLEQFINGVPVFRGEVKAGFSKSGEMVRVINNLAPGLEYGSLSNDFGDPAKAVKAAAGYINYELKSVDTALNAAASNDLKTVFGEGDWATTAEKMYFPTEPGVALPSWRVLIWEPVNAYYVIVDAETGTMLWRKNITNDQSQPVTYQVYGNPNAMINVADNPAPMTPGPTNPTLGTQAPVISRSTVTRVGNEAPYTFNNLGWVTDNTNVTDGNNVQAGLDRDGINGVDAPLTGIPNREFTSTWNPPPGNPAPGDDPLTPEAQRGAVTQMFYVMNVYHDELYRLGFTEAARNYQTDNFGRGGLGNDRVSAEGQDSAGTNNANFSSPADGTRGRMQMYIWPGPTPDYDGTTDAEIIIHEVTHGTSQRLHGNSSGLNNNMSAGMGEGWGDFYAHSMLSEPTDPIDGIYTTGGYATHLGISGYTANYYYGIRRFPKAIMASKGGPDNKPHNPLTFADADVTQFDISDGAFAKGPYGVSTVDQVHNLGEIWSSMLWEVRAKMITRSGWAIGNRKVLQLVTDGMKLAPLGPTFVQERDAIIAAAQASGTGQQVGPDVADIWAGFAIRGLGYGAKTIAAVGSGPNSTRVIEAYDLPNLQQKPTFTVSDAAGDNDGYPEPGETLALSIPLVNNTGNEAKNTTLQIGGGGSGNYGTIVNGQTATQTVNYTVPADSACGSTLNLTFSVNSSIGATSFTGKIILGVPVETFAENFDGVTSPLFPAGWTATSEAAGIVFVNSPLNPDTGATSAYAVNPTVVGGGTSLTSPSMAITTSGATVSFRNRYDTEQNWDGGALEISIGGGAFTDIITAGGRFIQNGYNGVLGNGTNNPLAVRQAWTGNSNGYVTTIAQFPPAAVGQNVQLRWHFGADNNAAGQGPNPGWYIDSVKVNGSFSCSVTPPTTNVKSRADFDGDGKTDVSVFRPSEGNWYLNRSTAGFTVASWGLASDVLVPGDYDGDNKAEMAIFRPSTGEWYILRSTDGGYSATPFGAAGDVPQAGDYDGDGKTDLAVFRPSTNVWYVSNSGGGTTILEFGASGDVPVRGDYDGDGKTDIAVFRPSTNQWWINRSTGSVSATIFGTTGDKLVPADYDGDGKDDLAVYRPSTGQWWMLRSSDNVAAAVTFGLATDIPAPGDYDGDGKDDQAVYRDGVWWLNRSTAGATSVSFGLPTDTALPTRYIP